MPNATVKRQLRILAVTVVIAPLAYWGPHLVEIVRDLEVFAVREGEIEVRGIERLTKQTVVSRLGLGSMASFWGDAAVGRACAWTEERADGRATARAPFMKISAIGGGIE